MNFLAQGASLVVGVLLPSVGVSLYFYSLPGSSEGNSESSESRKDSSEETAKPQFSYPRAFKLLWQHFLESYSNLKVIQWSVWWALAMAGFLMVQIYVQLLWQEIDYGRENLLNAGVEAALTLFGAIAAFLAGLLTSKTFKKYDLWILTFCSLLEGIFIVISSQTTNIWTAYSMYVLFGILYSFMITIASASVAKLLADDSFALIFGINTFFALIAQSILTVVVITLFGLSTRDQFLVYGFYFISLSVIYMITAIVKIIVIQFRKKNQYSVRD